ncbi:MAG TPA: VPLPA-CTERM sorting domain-containing protein [Candidatus Acidoferrum sp.]|nr:VPLPA-CTERM sorting domain-containing protein [Candidatus Acidoferrum sp.]
MKAFRLLSVVALLACAATISRADTVDPKITIGGGGSCASIDLTSLTQQANGLDTSCTTDFVNRITSDDEGVTLTQIVVNVTSAFDGVLSCATATDSPFFGQITGTNSCTFFVQSIFLETALFGTTSCTPNSGLAPGCKFGLSFDNEGGLGFGPTVDLTVSQTVIPAPEPASALLLLAGAGALAAFRKRRHAQA